MAGRGRGARVPGPVEGSEVLGGEGEEGNFFGRLDGKMDVPLEHHGPHFACPGGLVGVEGQGGGKGWHDTG